MNSIRVIIVDDEPPARRGIRKELEKYPEAEIIGEASNGEQAVELIRQTKPDLVFLDIQMPLMNGMEVVNHIGSGQFPAVVFVTAYDQYALEAFNVYAVDYLLKPIDPERFEKAYMRVKERMKMDRVSERDQKIEALIRHLEKDTGSRETSTRQRLVIKDAGKAFFLEKDEIVWIKASGNYLNIYVRNKIKPVLIRETMQNMEERLRSESFQRIHRSKLVNIENITEMERQGDGRYILKLTDGNEITSSRRYRQQVKKILSNVS